MVDGVSRPDGYTGQLCIVRGKVANDLSGIKVPLLLGPGVSLVVAL